jgi:DNA repair exonuclease SbcCD ATPase subunit
LPLVAAVVLVLTGHLQEKDHERYAWYFVDPETSANLTPGQAGSSSGPSEADAEKAKALEDREAALAQKEQDLSDEKKKLEDREASLAQKDEDSSKDKKALEEQEAALKQKQTQYSADVKALEDRKATLDQQENDSATGKKTFDDRTAAFTQKEKEFSASKKALDDREAALAKKEKERSAEWNKKMEELKKLQNSSAQQKKLSAGDSGCGYKHYKPPRKLEKKVIGLVYEK